MERRTAAATLPSVMFLLLEAALITVNATNPRSCFPMFRPMFRPMFDRLSGQ